MRVVTLLLCSMLLACGKDNPEAFGEITWHGEKYQLSRKFENWEDYKKAQDQVAPSEAPRVLAKALSLQVPAKFVSFHALVEGMPRLDFPGYGYSTDGSVRDGSGRRYQLSEYPIPLAKRQRVVLYREEANGSYTLVLDQVVETGHDQHSEKRRNVVEGGKLRVYINGKFHREAALKPAV
jgi:hypothetical protein